MKLSELNTKALGQMLEQLVDRHSDQAQMVRNEIDRRRLGKKLPAKKGARRPASRFVGLSRGNVSARGSMNHTEKRYAAELEQRRILGEVAAWWFEPCRLRITSAVTGGKSVYYTPDFLVLMPDGATYVDDVKGAGIDNEGSIVRLKTAAEKFSLWTFRLVKERPKKQGGGFKVTEL